MTSSADQNNQSVARHFEIPLKHTVLIRCSPERVYQTLTSSEGWDSWFTQGTELDLKSGGRIQLRWKDFGPDKLTVEDGGPVLEFEENKYFSFQWNPQGIEDPTTVRFTLDERPGTDAGPYCRLTVEERGFLTTMEGQQAFQSCATGWGEACTLLKFYLEHGITYSK